MADRQFQPDCVCKQLDVTLYQARDRTMRLTITNDIGDITGSKLWMSVKRSLDDADTDAVITKLSANNGGSDDQCKVVDGVNRIIEFYIVPDDTRDLDYGDYWWDAVIELPDGRRLQLVDPSRFDLQRVATLTS